jgi:hypothetical protein
MPISTAAGADYQADLPRIALGASVGRSSSGNEKLGEIELFVKSFACFCRERGLGQVTV